MFECNYTWKGVKSLRRRVRGTGDASWSNTSSLWSATPCSTRRRRMHNLYRRHDGFYVATGIRCRRHDCTPSWLAYGCHGDPNDTYACNDGLSAAGHILFATLGVLQYVAYTLPSDTRHHRQPRSSNNVRHVL